MAYLNVRERRIEAKIVYVGPELSGKTTNFDLLRRTTQDARISRIDTSIVADDGDALAIAWQPPEGARFRDCDVLVKLAAPRARGPASLGDVDGVVVVADAHPAATARNRDALVSLHEALGRAERASVPVVVQVNKTDLPDALPVNEVVAAMGAEALPHVAASALRGHGVVDTLEVALNTVLARMQREGDPLDGAIAARTAVAASPEDAKDAGHPLLAALRQVLRETVREHVRELEARLYARLGESLGRVIDGQARAATAANDSRLVLADIGEIVMDVLHRTTALTDRSHATFESVRDLAPTLGALRSSLAEHHARTEEALQALRREVAEVVKELPSQRARSIT